MYIPLVHRAGDEAQVDFFEVTVEVAGQRRKAWQFLLRLMYSGRDFVWLYERCDRLAFLDGHVRAFQAFGGLPARCVYYNLAPAVARIAFPRRQLTQRFQALVSHYVFEPCFARIGVGHDKGGVEARGNAIRLQHLVPIPQGPSLPAIAEELLAGIDHAARQRRDARGVSVAERFAQKCEVLRPLPLRPFDPRKVMAVSIRSTSTVKVEGAWYSVPSHWARLEAMAYVGVEEVQIVCRGETVTHPRQSFGSRSIRYRHYLRELAHKPQAVRQVAPGWSRNWASPLAGCGSCWRAPTAPMTVHASWPGSSAPSPSRGRRQCARPLRRRRVPRGAYSFPLLLSASLGLPVRSPCPLALAAYQVPTARAADYDALLVGGRS